MRYHHQNLTDGRLPLWREGRAWWGPVGWSWGFPSALGPGFSIGLRSFHISLWFMDFFVYDWRVDYSYRHEFSIRWHDGCIWIDTPWKRPMEWRSSDPWWRKGLVLHVKDWLLGRTRYETVKGTPFAVYVPMPEGSYLATATPETTTWRRRFYVPVQRRESVVLDIPGGIPHSGKGENAWDCGDDGLCGIGGDTVEEAIGNAVASVLKSRRRYGHDSKSTGRVPAIVLNLPKHAA